MSIIKYLDILLTNISFSKHFCLYIFLKIIRK